MTSQLGQQDNYKTHIEKYFTTIRQLDDETWSIKRISQEKYFSSKIIQNFMQGDLFQNSFLFKET